MDNKQAARVTSDRRKSPQKLCIEALDEAEMALYDEQYYSDNRVEFHSGMSKAFATMLEDVRAIAAMLRSRRSREALSDIEASTITALLGKAVQFCEDVFNELDVKKFDNHRRAAKRLIRAIRKIRWAVKYPDA